MNQEYNLTQEEYEEEFIRLTIGDSTIPWRELLPLTITYTLFLTVGLMGNVATIFVIVKNEYMKTATNLYLLNLAVADIFNLVIGRRQHTSMHFL